MAAMRCRATAGLYRHHHHHGRRFTSRSPPHRLFFGQSAQGTTGETYQFDPPTLHTTSPFERWPRTRANYGLNLCQEGEKIVVERLGKFHRVATPGWFVAIPFVDKLAYVVDTRERSLEVGSSSASAAVGGGPAADAYATALSSRAPTKTADGVGVHATGHVTLVFVDPERAAYGSSHPIQAVRREAHVALRAALGDVNLDDLTKSREVINERVSKALKGRAALTWGLDVKGFALSDVQPDNYLVSEAMDRVALAERDQIAHSAVSSHATDAARRALEADRLEAAARAEADAERTELEAKAKAEALRAYLLMPVSSLATTCVVLLPLMCYASSKSISLLPGLRASAEADAARLRADAAADAILAVARALAGGGKNISDEESGDAKRELQRHTRDAAKFILSQQHLHVAAEAAAEAADAAALSAKHNDLLARIDDLLETRARHAQTTTTPGGPAATRDDAAALSSGDVPPPSSPSSGPGGPGGAAPSDAAAGG